MPKDERWTEYEIGDFLKERRKESSIHLRDIAAKLNMAHTNPHYWEEGQSFPATLARLARWCKVLDLTLEITLRDKQGEILRKWHP